VTRAYVAMGANLGDAVETFRAALRAMRGLGRVTCVSGLYRSPALGVALPQPDFTNAVVGMETRLAPEALLAGLLTIEEAHGRVRPPGHPPLPEPRTLDLDLLLYGQEVRQRRLITLPHPRLAGRAFVIEPLLEVAPEAAWPTGLPIRRAAAVGEAVRIAGPEWAAGTDAAGDVAACEVWDDLEPATRLDGPPVYVYGRIGSTTDALRVLAAMGAPDGTAVVAEEQTAGRGRHGRRWEAARGSALLVSVLVQGAGGAGSLLPLVAGIAAVEAVAAVGGPPIRLKWPNDLLWQGRKAGGILVRLAGGSALVGVGLNVRRLARDRLVPAQEHVAFLTSRRRLPRHRLLAALRTALQAETDLLRRHGAGPVLARWAERSDTLGSAVMVHAPGGEVWPGRAVRLGEDGALWVEDAAGAMHAVHAGEVSIRLDAQRDQPVWVHPPA
jgi:2-amino-4-hydroxy-6-hydroxymethyldihydropteridine diphosphokinase